MSDVNIRERWVKGSWEFSIPSLQFFGKLFQNEKLNNAL